MPINRVYHTWLSALLQLHPYQRITVLRNFAWLIAGIYMSRSIHLSRIADEITWRVKLPSATRRLSRLLANRRLRVREWYEPIARALLAAQIATLGEVRLIVDGTKVSFNHQLLMVAIAFRRRTLPIAWTWIPSKRGHSSAAKQKALLAYVRKLIPAGTPVLVVGDAEFGEVPVLKLLDAWKWSYVFRQRASFLVRLPQTHVWQPLGHLITTPGQQQWLPAAFLTQKHQYPVNLLLYWKPGEKKPWLLATNLTSASTARRSYQRRMWIDEMFGDFKGHGVNLEASHVRHFMRLSRLTLAVAMLYVWLVSSGSSVIKRGLRHLVDRKDRRDLSIFRIGWSFIKLRLKHQRPFPFRLLPYFR